MNFVNFVNKCAVCLFFQESVYVFQENYENETVHSISRQDNLIEAIAEGRFLLLSPLPHHVPNKSRCTRAECIAMNAMAETIALAATAKAAKRQTGRR